MHWIFRPILADTLRNLAGPENVFNATDLFMHPGHGLRAHCTPFEIAYFEYTNGQAAEAVKRMIFALREGMTDHSVVESGRLNGDPLAATSRSAPAAMPTRPLRTERRTDSPRPTLAFNVAYWGSNICRAGWIADSAADLPDCSLRLCCLFCRTLFRSHGRMVRADEAGHAGTQFYDLIQDRLPFEQFGIYLNPGHLIHLDEWMSSPFYAGSEIPVASGMAIQVDVIPQSSLYFSTRMEDGIVVADSGPERRN